MILPDKHTPPERAILTVGGLVLEHLSRPLSLNRLWERVRDDPMVRSYDAFMLTLAFLYAIGAVAERDGRLARTHP
jgi:hypothetical protein